MSNLLHLQARAAAPVVCDMNTAEDTPQERLGSYAELFARSLVRRERRAGAVVFVFRADPGTRDTVEDVARREAVCCPFLEYRVETDADDVVWTTTNPVTGDARASADAILDAFHDLPDHAGSGAAGPFARRDTGPRSGRGPATH